MKAFAYKIAATLACGALLRLVVGLEPIWWMVWVAPVPLLWLAFRHSRSDAGWMVALAAITATSANFTYLHLVMPLPAVLGVLAGQSLLWVFVIMATRRVVLRYQNSWAVFAYPVFWVACDTLLAAFHPDGNWGSVAYSQAEVLPLLQITALFGVAGLLFLVTLVPSAIALLLCYRRGLSNSWIAYGSATLLLFASLAYGMLRLIQPTAGTATVFGLAAIDDAIGLQASADYRNNILQRYDQHVTALAARGALVIVLPEKMALLPAGDALLWQQHFADLAAKQRVRLLASVGVVEDVHPVNLAWLFEADGSQVSSYEKQRLAPPERRQGYRAGTAYAVHNVAGFNYGLAICKDMHFASLGRAYGQRGAAVMLVPAWDFNFMDQQLEARTTLTRGVENGYAVVRVAREGLLTVSDAYGRILAEQQSAKLPGSELLVALPVAPQLSTLYTRIGNLLGWMCVTAAVVLLLIGRRRRT